MRRVILQLHLIVALAGGVVIFAQGLTGSIMAFEPELSRLQHWRIAHVRSQGRPLTLEKIAQAIRKASPDSDIQGYILSAQPELSYQVMVSGQLLYIDQYSGQVLGTINGGMDFLGFVHQFHLRLALLDKGREFGQMTVRWSALGALFLLMSGVYLWWPGKRLGIAGSTRTAKFWFDVHNTVGIVSAVFVLLLIVTGLVISFEAQTTPFFYRITQSQPTNWLSPKTAVLPDGVPITADQALAIALTTVPGAAPVGITVPHGDQAYQAFLRYPEDRTPGGRTRVVVDSGGKVLMVIDSRRAPAGYRLVNLNRALHTGDVLGFPTKAVAALASLVMPCQLLTGVVLWMKRRRNKKTKFPFADPQID